MYTKTACGLLCVTNRQNRDFSRKVQRPTEAGSQAGAVAPTWLAVLPLCVLVVATLAISSTALQSAEPVQRDRPNIVLILSDDYGLDGVGR